MYFINSQLGIINKRRQNQQKESKYVKGVNFLLLLHILTPFAKGVNFVKGVNFKRSQFLKVPIINVPISGFIRKNKSSCPILSYKSTNWHIYNWHLYNLTPFKIDSFYKIDSFTKLTPFTKGVKICKRSKKIDSFYIFWLLLLILTPFVNNSQICISQGKLYIKRLSFLYRVTYFLKQIQIMGKLQLWVI